MSKIKVISVVGVRPQIIKASAISRAIETHYSDKIEEVMIHTGQHYDSQLSDIFFEELRMAKPKYNLRVGSAKYGRQTASMLAGIEDVILKEKPDCVMVYGSTNSTLAGALASAKFNYPVVHIDAGVRSFNKSTSEELNCVLTDHASTLLFAPTNAAFKNLMREGFRPENSYPYNIDNPKIFLTGDIMYDNALFFSDIVEHSRDEILKNMQIEPNNYVVVTVHRDINANNVERLAVIFHSILRIADEYKMRMVMPLHPRTINALEGNSKELYKEMLSHEYIRIKPPVSYFTMTALIRNCRMVITDSVGIQKEAHFASKPSLVLRKETEWVELVKNGTVKLVDADAEAIINGYIDFDKNRESLSFPTFYGDGKAAEFILNEVSLLK